MNNQLIRGNLFLFSKPEPESKQFEKGERFFLNQAGTTESLFIVLRVTKENQLILARAFPTQQKNTCKVIIGRKEYWVCFSNLLFAERKWLSDITIYQGRCSYGNISKIYSCYNNWKEQIKKQAREKAIRKREEKIALRKARKERLERERLALYDGKKQDDICVPSYLSNYARHVLTYSFYKQPSFILRLFQIRLREIMKINAVPALVIGIGLALILFATGGTDNPLNYVVLVVSILCMSLFFSIHYLTIYYLLQPYNAGTELKSGTYRIVLSVTYVICFALMRLRMPIMIFGIMTIVFCVLYSIVASILVYRLAPKTFRLRT